MVFQRAQHNEAETPFELNISDGQHGRGVYAFMKKSKAMREYYTKKNEKLYEFEIPDELIKDLSDKDFDYWTGRAFMFNNPQYLAFIFKHKGIGIPTSKEVIITDPICVKNLRKV